MTIFSTGKNAYAECMRCGFLCKYNDLIEEQKGLWVCPYCNDGIFNRKDHPLNMPTVWRLDPEGLAHRHYAGEVFVSASAAVWVPTSSTPDGV